jgi:hypothetical protein
MGNYVLYIIPFSDRISLEFSWKLPELILYFLYFLKSRINLHILLNFGNVLLFDKLFLLYFAQNGLSGREMIQEASAQQKAKNTPDGEHQVTPRSNH